MATTTQLLAVSEAPPVEPGTLRRATPPSEAEVPTFLDALTRLAGPASQAGAPAAPETTVVLHRGRESIAPLAAEWSRLCDLHGGPIEQWDWATCNAPADPRSVEIVTVHGEGPLLAIAALGRRRVRGVSRRVMLGVGEHYEPMEFLAANDTALDSLTSRLAGSGMPLICGRLPEESATVASLQRAFRKRGLVRTRREAAAPYITLDDSWRSPENHLNSGRRSDLRRAGRRAAKGGSVEYEILTPSPGEVGPLLDEAIRIENESWKGTAGTALACDPARADFFRRYSAQAAGRGALRVCFLRIAGRAIAMQIAVVQSRRFWLLKVGYDAAYSRCSPGLLLMNETISWAARERLLSYEFLGRSEAWTEVWTQQERSCVSIVAYPRSFAGAAALVADSVAAAAAKTNETLTAGVARCRSAARGAVAKLVQRASRSYIAGPALDDACRVRDALHSRGTPSTIGFWDKDGDEPRAVADEYLAGLDRLAETADDAYLSIKLPSLKFDGGLLRSIADRARSYGRRIHFDALATADAEPTRTLVTGLRKSHPDLTIGFTLPGRWRRSLDDADWAVEQQLAVRVVKGQWADPEDAGRDLRTGYLEVIDRLAGRARHVSVASHDVTLATEAVNRLRAAGTPCDLELLYGLPSRASLQAARKLNLAVRVYVPYGAAYLPYAVARLRRNPRVAWWLIRDFAASFVWE